MKETVTFKHGNHEIVYQRLPNGTCYHVETSQAVIDTLEYAMNRGIRVKLHYGDTDTGRDWNEEHDVEGYIGRSGGDIKVPLLVYNARSYGGGAILDHCIVRITTASGGHPLYTHPLYQESTFEITDSDLPEYSHNVLIDGVLYARCHSEKEARRLVAWMRK